MRNMFRAFLICLITFLFIGCQPNYDLSEDVITKANDNKITKDEFLEIRQKTMNSEEYQPIRDSSRLFNYIVTLLKGKGIRATVWNPSISSADTAFNVNFYLETSGSMRGYVSSMGQTHFQDAIQNILESIFANNLCNELSLNYITSAAIVPIKEKVEKLSEIEDFAQNPYGENKKFGKDSKLEDVINEALGKSDPHTVSILVSDFILSPNKGIALDYLSKAKTSIKSYFTKKLRQQKDLAVAIFRIESKFNGPYYTYNQPHQGIKLVANRPFYFWVIGPKKYISGLFQHNIFGENAPRVVFVNPSNHENLNYKILIGEQYTVGSYGVDGNNIKDANPDNNLFGFTIAVNLDGSLQAANYLVNPSNYYISDTSYKISIRKSEYQGYHYKIKVTTNRLLPSENLKIGLLGRCPKWVQNSSSSDDSKIKIDPQEQQKTFGLKYLVGGINDAFFPDTRTNIISELTIQINK